MIPKLNCLFKLVYSKHLINKSKRIGNLRIKSDIFGIKRVIVKITPK